MAADPVNAAHARVVAVGAIGMVLVVVAGGVFDRVPWTASVAPVSIAAVGCLVPTQRRAVRAVALAAAGAAAVVAATLLAGGTGDDVRTGLVDGPRLLLTTEWPSPFVPGLVATITALISVGLGVATWLAAVPRWHLAPLLPLLAALVGLIALGAPAPPAGWALAAGGVCAGALTLVPVGRPLRAVVSARTGDRALAGSVVVLALTAVAGSTVVARSDRADPRRLRDADATVALLDPIEATAALRSSEPPIELFSMATPSAGPLPSRWRIAALDEYDGQRWVPRVTLRPIGERLGHVDPLVGTTTVTVRLLGGGIDLVPIAGRPITVDRPVETDVDRVVVRLVDGAHPGLSVRVESELPPSLVSGASFSTRPVDEIAGGFTDAATTLAGDGDVVERLRRIEATMSDEWILDPAAPGGGQQLALVERFVEETHRGTREQFVTAFVLLVRSLGIDARVATGFVVPPDRSSDDEMRIDSSDATAWPEVHLATGAWVAFDPVPTVEGTVDDEAPDPPEAQTPAAAQPPIRPPTEDGEDGGEVEPLERGGDGGWNRVAELALRVGVGTTGTVLPFALAAVAVVALKWRRRRRRLEHPDPVRRVRGAWANATDLLVDAGLTISPAWTDEGVAARAAALVPASPHELRRLAAMATAVTFGPPGRAVSLADDAVRASRLIEQSLLDDRSRWQRLRHRVSLRSLRRATRSPITE